jgi:hypothetical protein
MAITGVLQADFSSFYTAAQKAEASLKGMEGGAVKVETTFNRMAEGPIRPMNTLRESFGQVDQVLNASGVNVGKYARGLVEISEMSGKTASELGGLATAASVFAAAMAGWQFGTWIAGITGLDKAVAKYADSLTNLPTEVAAAKQDTINRAIANGAAATISYTDAIKFNVEQMQAQNDKYAVSSERLANAQREVRGLSAATVDAIAIAQKNGATTQEITRHFDISADALRQLGERQKQTAQEAAAHTKALEKQREVIEKLDKEYAKLMSDVKNANQLALMEEEAAAMKRNAEQAAMFAEEDIKARIRRQQAISDQTAAEANAEAARVAANQAEIDGLLAAGEAHFKSGVVAKDATDQTIAGYQGVAQQVSIAAGVLTEWLTLMQYSAQVQAIQSENSLFTSTSQKQRIAGLGGPSINNTFNIVDTEANIAKRVSDQIMRTVKSGTQLAGA